VDEAHAVGVAGATGRGVAEHFGCADAPDVQMVTLSKALGSEGAAVCARREIVEWLVNKARSFIFTTAPCPAAAGAAIAALDILEGSPELAGTVLENAKYLAVLLGTHTDSAIVPVVVGDEARALEAASRLATEGWYVPAIRYPTVPRGKARLRISVSAAHTKGELDMLAEATRRALNGR
ncbi:MAG: aminotransferase class I/II-fold pyridoxal phosphate-dependent enzyme, partial [Kiritimatiellae bacterium]|nr:aminotransferase class I/II-fold pyridoxal phosphate-dependent enzyme [Kiritimatiellia bacterium]